MKGEDRRPKTKDRNQIDWSKVERVLVVKLRSIGDTVLATPALIALRRFLPDARIDILLEDWVAPVLDGFDVVDNVLTVGNGTVERLRMAAYLRRQRYDIVFNLHGGTTAAWFTRASGARVRVGYSYYQYSFLYNHLLSSASEFWGKDKTHSAEQQLALIGSVGVSMDSRERGRLVVTAAGKTERISEWRKRGNYALLHPGTAFFTKRWAAENFARTAEFLSRRGFEIVAIGTMEESPVLDRLIAASSVAITVFDDLTLPEITALAANAKVFVGNDSGIAHIAAAVDTPSVVIFGSSNRDHWRPWTDAPNEIVYEEFACQPCPGYECKEFGEPRCILSVRPEKVFAAIEGVLSRRK